MCRTLAAYKEILFASFDEVRQWKINEIRYFYLPPKHMCPVNWTVGIISDCLAMFRIQWVFLNSGF